MRLGYAIDLINEWNKLNDDIERIDFCIKNKNNLVVNIYKDFTNIALNVSEYSTTGTKKEWDKFFSMTISSFNIQFFHKDVSIYMFNKMGIRAQLILLLG